MKDLERSLSDWGKVTRHEAAFHDRNEAFDVYEVSDMSRHSIRGLLLPTALQYVLAPLLENIGALVFRTRDRVSFRIGMTHELSVIDGKASDISFKIPHQDMGPSPHLHALYSGPRRSQEPDQADTLLFGFRHCYEMLLFELGPLSDKLASVSSGWASQRISPLLGMGPKDPKAMQMIAVLQQILPLVQQCTEAEYQRMIRTKPEFHHFAMLAIPYLLTSFCVDRDDPDILQYLDRFYARMEEDRAMFRFDWNERSSEGEQVMLLWAGHKHFHALGPEKPGRKRESLQRALIPLED